MRSSTLPLAAWQRDSVLVCAEVGLAADGAWTGAAMDGRSGIWMNGLVNCTL